MGWDVLTGITRFPVCRISIENEYIREDFPLDLLRVFVHIRTIYGQGITKKLTYQSLEHMKQQEGFVAFPVSIFHTAVSSSGLEIISNKISLQYQGTGRFRLKVKTPGMYGVWTGTIPIFMSCIRILHQSHTAARSGNALAWEILALTIGTWQFTSTSHADLWSI